jgi:hypothetical protein
MKSWPQSDASLSFVDDAKPREKRRPAAALSMLAASNRTILNGLSVSWKSVESLLSCSEVVNGSCCRKDSFCNVILVLPALSAWVRGFVWWRSAVWCPGRTQVRTYG